MPTYDWVVIGAGITGSALSYELAKQGYRVLLLEKDARPDNATYYSYGGLAYWSGTYTLTRQICQEGIDLHRQLSGELGADTEFRDIDLVLTIDADSDPKAVAAHYSQFAIAPQILDRSEACQLEPLLNPDAIAGSLRLPHAHINPDKTNLAYQQAFRRIGGEIKIEPVVGLLRRDNRIEGVMTNRDRYYAQNTAVCAGGLSRVLLEAAGICSELYFTHAHLIKTPPADVCLRTLVMPAMQQRLLLEEKAIAARWDEPSSESITSIFDPGAVQFRDRSVIMGQISEIYTSPDIAIDRIASEAKIRNSIASILPLLGNIPGTWHSCLVAFAKNSLPLIGEIDPFANIYLFSGFTSTLVFAPPLARHFANWIATGKDKIIAQLDVISATRSSP